jgi:hypothetical protein
MTSYDRGGMIMTPKFKVGNVYRHKGRTDRFKVIKIANEGETVEGSWMSGKAAWTMKRPCYISEFLEPGSNYKKFCFTPIANQDDCELVVDKLPVASNKGYSKHYKCPTCTAPAYLNFFNSIECSNPQCENHK